MKLKDRVEKARASARFARVEKKSPLKHIVYLPGNDAKIHRVIVTRSISGWVCDCSIDAGAYGNITCIGSKHGVCYHMVAAVIAIAAENDHSVAVCRSLDDAMHTQLFKAVGGINYAALRTISSVHTRGSYLHLVVYSNEVVQC